MSFALAFTVVSASTAFAAGLWLDEALQPWNSPGAPVPAASPRGVNFQEICVRQERPAASTEETQLAAAGWRLEEYWPTQRLGTQSLIVATSNYDGMCRPWLFNVFAFAEGHYAGTLSPVHMNSRTDGVLKAAPTFLADRRIEAVFIRYAATDPLCCPSLGVSWVTYHVQSAAGGPVVVPERVEAQAPQQLPNTGEDLITAPGFVAAVGMLLLGLGVLLWRRRLHA